MDLMGAEMIDRNIHSSSSKYLTLSLFSLLILCILFQSCVQGDHVRRVNPDKAITLLDGGPHQGTWQTQDLSFQYTYHQAPNEFTISGYLELNNHYTMDYNTLKDFLFVIVLLDAELNVIKRSSLANVSFGTQEEGGSIKHSFEGPEVITGISFGYRGDLRANGAMLDLYASPFN
jgi:hypothetical protein